MKTNKGTKLNQSIANVLNFLREGKSRTRVLCRRVGRAWTEAKSEIIDRNISGRTTEIYPDDVLIVSYPKSGNTWVRFLIGNLLHEDPVTFANVEQKIPSLYSSNELLQHTPRPRYLKSHEYFDPRYKTVIYIVRDPRDVAISYYHFWVKVGLIEEDYPIDDYISRFANGELDGFGSWRENVGSWLGTRENDPGFLFLRYEDLLDDPVRELRKVANFLSIRTSYERLNEAIELSSADRMRKSEREHDWEAIKESRKDKSFVRTAQAGGWQNDLPEASVVLIEKLWGRMMERLGYQLQDTSHE